MGDNAGAVQCLRRWSVAAALLLAAALQAAEPARPAPSAQQQAKLQQRDRLVEQSRSARLRGDLPAAIAAFEKVLALEREVFGEVHAEVAGSLGWLAQLAQKQEDFAAARRRWREALQVWVQLHGERHWRVTDTRLALADIDRLERLDREQRQQWRQAEQLSQQAVELCNHKKFAQALPPAQEALRIRQRLLGEQHVLTAECLQTLGWAYREQKDYDRAEAFCQRALTIRRQCLGEDHPQVARTLNNLGWVYADRRQYERAEALFQQAATIHERAEGKQGDGWRVSRNNLVRLYGARARQYEGAQDFQQAARDRGRVAEIQAQLLGAEHWRVIDARQAQADDEGLAKMTAEERQRLAEAARLNREALSLYRQGRSREGFAPARQALEIRRQLLGKKHPDYAITLINLAALYRDQGKSTRAEPLLRQACRICRQALGDSHPVHANALLNLAEVYHDQEDYRKAESLYQQALQIFGRTLGEQHPRYASGLNSLAGVYKNLGDYARAEPLYRRALQIEKQAMGERHAEYATALSNLAVLYEEMGDYARAEPLLQQALRIRKGVLGENHLSYAMSLENLGDLYRALGERRKAAALYWQTLEIKKRIAGNRHPSCVRTLKGLAGLCADEGEYAGAERHYRQALQIDREVLGEKHPTYALDLNNLADSYRSRGDYARAEPLYRQSLQILQQVLGKRHPLCVTIASNLAASYWSEAAPLELLALQPAPLPSLVLVHAAAANMAWAQQRVREALEQSRDSLELAAAVQSQRQQLDMLKQLRYWLDVCLSLPPGVFPGAAQPYEAVLTWKGAVGRRQRFQRLARQDAKLAGDFAELDRLTAQLSALALTVPTPGQTASRHQEMQKLTGQKEALEADLARKSAAFRKGRPQYLRAAQLQAALPAGAVLLDFLEHWHVDPSLEKVGAWRAERRLAVFVVRRDGLVRVELPRLQEMRLALEQWRLALQRRFRTESDARLAQRVRQLLWEPLAEHIRGAQLVLVSPDGVLNRVPLGALPGSQRNTYLLEEVALAIVPVPQQLPDMLAAGDEGHKSEPSLLLVGDVSYDSTLASVAAAGDSRAAPRRGSDALFHWPALPNTGIEVTAIGEVFRRHCAPGRVSVLRQSEATEASVRGQAPAHRYLHFATHGYFAPRELRSALAELSRGEGKPGELFQRRDVAGFHPGLLSGLVLAGANQPVTPQQDDGILTALEVESLNLSGVELVTLSACETGLGEEAGGEGLLGLQRAFQIAGAGSAVAGLWQVDDTATRQLMTQFYSNLWQKKLSRLEALRQAQLWMLRHGEEWMQGEGLSRGMVDVRVPQERLPVEDGRLAPYYWAAFVLSGDWR